MRPRTRPHAGRPERIVSFLLFHIGVLVRLARAALSAFVALLPGAVVAVVTLQLAGLTNVKISPVGVGIGEFVVELYAATIGRCFLPPCVCPVCPSERS